MYKGEANVPQQMLTAFIKDAESLQIRGLAEGANKMIETEGILNRPPVQHSTPINKKSKHSNAHQGKDNSNFQSKIYIVCFSKKIHLFFWFIRFSPCEPRRWQRRHFSGPFGQNEPRSHQRPNGNVWPHPRKSPCLNYEEPGIDGRFNSATISPTPPHEKVPKVFRTKAKGRISKQRPSC